MSNLNKYNTDKATVCYNNACATVYGEAARMISMIVVVTVAIIAASMLAKVMK